MLPTAAGKARRGIGQVSDAPAGLLGPKGTAKGQAVPIEGSFSFLCLHAAVALTPLLPKAHSLLLTSGTLSPVAPLVAELGLGAKPKRQPSSPHASVPTGASSADIGHMLPDLPQPLPTQQQPHQQQQFQQQQQQQNGPPDSEGVHEKPGQKLALPAGSQAGSAMQGQQAHSTAASSALNLQGPSLGQAASQPAGAAQLEEALPQSNMGQTVCHQRSMGKREQQQKQQQQQQQEVQFQQVQQLQQQQQQVQQQQPARSQHARFHEGVELVSAPHHHTLPARLLPLTISMAPGPDGQLVKLDSAYERRQDTGTGPGLHQCPAKKRKETPLGVMMGASRPRGSPRLLS